MASSQATPPWHTSSSLVQSPTDSAHRVLRLHGNHLPNPSVKEELVAVVAPTMDFEPAELAGEMLHNCYITSFRFFYNRKRGMVIKWVIAHFSFFKFCP